MTTTPLIVRNCRWVAVPGSADARGSVNFLESGKGLETRLVLIAMHGGCRVHLDDGATRQSVMLDDPTCALQLDTWVWHELTDFAPATAIAVLASTPYEEAEYVRDYDTFKREAGVQAP